MVAERGREFAWVISGNLVRWGYTMTTTRTATVLTETWDFLPDGITFFEQTYGDEATAQVNDRIQLAHHGISTTLAVVFGTFVQLCKATAA